MRSKKRLTELEDDAAILAWIRQERDLASARGDRAMERGDDFTPSRHRGEKSALPSFSEGSRRGRAQGYPDLFRPDRVRRRRSKVACATDAPSQLASRESYFANFAKISFASSSVSLLPISNQVPFDLIRFHRASRVEPLDETPRLIRIVSRRDVGRERDRASPAKNNKARCRSAVLFGFSGFSSNCVITPSRVRLDAGVFLDRLQVADIVGRERRCRALRLAAQIPPAVR